MRSEKPVELQQQPHPPLCVIGKRLRWFAIFLFRAPSPRQPPLEMHGMRSEKPVELQQQPHPPLCVIGKRLRWFAMNAFSST